MPKAKASPDRALYSRLLEHVFFSKRRRHSTIVNFERGDLEAAARSLKLRVPKNLGDVIYSYRYRGTFSSRIMATQPKNKEWIIEGVGTAKYAFKLVPLNRIVPDPNYALIKIPDATPEIIEANKLSDEQALLAKVRYNRLIDIFLGVAAYSLQNHLRTTVKEIGQIEIDEVYVGVDRSGAQYIIPVQAKGGKDQLSIVQTSQDIRCCELKFSKLVCRAVSAQFMADNRIALFELKLVSDSVQIVRQCHYHLVPSSEISLSELKAYRESETE